MTGTSAHDARVYVAGYRGMVGSAIVHQLHSGGYDNLLVHTRAELDLLDQRAMHGFLAEQRPDYIFIAAAKVGGIHANNESRADFLYQNLQIEANPIHGAHTAGVRRLMFLSSSCIYPRDCPQPIKEECLLTGPLEATNESYASAKIAGVKLCESYQRQYGRQCVRRRPTNLYRPERQLRPGEEPRAAGADPQGTRSEAARRCRERGLGQRHATARVPLPRRPDRRLSVPDGVRLRRAAGQRRHRRGRTIRKLAEPVMNIVEFNGRIVFDASKPERMPRNLLDVGRPVALSWRAPGIGRRHRCSTADFVRQYTEQSVA